MPKTRQDKINEFRKQLIESGEKLSTITVRDERGRVVETIERTLEERRAAADAKQFRTRIAEAVETEIKAARRTESALAANMVVRVRNSVMIERAALAAQATEVNAMKAVGFAQEVAEGSLMAGRAIRHAKRADVNGATASVDAPKGEIRIKSDGKRDRPIDAARRRHGRETDRPEHHWDGVEGIQNASLKDDAADTGEWFG